MPRRWTIGLLAGAIALLVGWDLWVAANDVPGDTISEVVLGWSRKVWTLPLAVGVVCGHWFWPRAPQPRWITVSLFSGLAVTAITFDVVGHPEVLPAIPFAIGVLVGHFGWGQAAR